MRLSPADMARLGRCRRCWRQRGQEQVSIVVQAGHPWGVSHRASLSIAGRKPRFPLARAPTPGGDGPILPVSIWASDASIRTLGTDTAHLRDQRRACAVTARRSFARTVQVFHFPPISFSDPTRTARAARGSSNGSDVWAHTKSTAGDRDRATPRPMWDVHHHAGCEP
jgi:hypothetical protein